MTFLHAMATLWPKTKHLKPILKNAHSVVISKIKHRTSRLVSQTTQPLKSCLNAFFKINPTCITFIIALFMCTSAVYSQQTLKPLKAGDPIPEEIWNMELELHSFNGERKTIKFDSLKGKLILLDFWSTSCRSCIEGIPKMEMIQSKFGANVYVLMVNSKRNKDTPARIKNSFQTYKESFGYVPLLPTLLDDTVMTTLFPHNTIPTLAWINKEGVFLGNTFPSEAQYTTVKNVIDRGTANLSVNQMFENLDRTSATPLIDTVGHQSMSIFSKHRDNHLAVYPNVFYNNGNTFMHTGNFSWSSMLSNVFQEELAGFHWADYVFDPQISEELRSRLVRGEAADNSYWYQFYTNDSIPEKEVTKIYKDDFKRHFGVSVARKQDSVDVYEIQLTKAFEKTRTKGEMKLVHVQNRLDELTFRNIPLSLFIQNLSYLIDRPTEWPDREKVSVDITLPAGFAFWKEQDKIDFLTDLGILLVPKRVYKLHPYFYHFTN